MLPDVIKGAVMVGSGIFAAGLLSAYGARHTARKIRHEATLTTGIVKGSEPKSATKPLEAKSTLQKEDDSAMNRESAGVLSVSAGVGQR